MAGSPAKEIDEMGLRLGRPTRFALKAAVVLTASVAFVTAVTRFVVMLLREPKPSPGYTLIAPVLSTNTHLIDMQGRVVHKWESDYNAGQVAYLLENGHLLRAGQLLPEERLLFSPAAGGHVQEFTWEGELVWDFTLHTATKIPHHDLARLPNGNVLLLVWEVKSAEETIAAGRRADSVDGPWLVDSVVEIKPTGRTGGEVVWQWHAWDHIVQDHDPARQNYADVAAHPELIDVNFGHALFSEYAMAAAPTKDEGNRKRDLKALRSIGYLGPPTTPGGPQVIPDWTHVNAISYNAELDQIMLCVRAFGEFWIIDHSTTTTEARSHTGGRGGKGGDLLYRWGNPQAYRAGSQKDQRLFVQHDAHWIEPDCPGAGHVLVFNNGKGRLDYDYSSVDEIVPSIDAQGRYVRDTGRPFGPREPVWRFTAPIRKQFSVGFLSGAQRLPNGNTLICDGVKGILFEVSPNHDVVWEYAHKETPKVTQTVARSTPAGPGSSSTRIEILPASTRDVLKLTDDQRKQLDALQGALDRQFATLLNDEQRQRLQERSVGRSSAPAPPGQIMSLATQITLKLTIQQKKTLAEQQKQIDESLAGLFTAEQKTQFQMLQQQFPATGVRLCLVLPL